MRLDQTHDARRRSWVGSANEPGTDFPIQNLPFGVFSRAPGEDARIGVAIGDAVMDLRAASDLGLMPEVPAEAARAATVEGLVRQGPGAMSALRARLSDLLDHDRGEAARRHADALLAPQASVRMHLPTRLRNYTDFYAGIHHARAAGALLTPENPLPANYKWVPIAYHGRASSVQVSGMPVRRPRGQRSPESPEMPPGFGPSRRLDLELEMGFYVAQGNSRGEPVPVSAAADRIAGFCILNDWSACDVQRWEMFPLGPFLSKSFATSVSPWMVTVDALAPFRVPAMARPAGDPAPLRYLFDPVDQGRGGLAVALEVWWSTRRMRDDGAPPVRIIASDARHLYWTPAQMLAHHTVNGCDLRAGDLIGTGTISGPTEAELSSLLELTVGGTRPVTLPGGETRTFLEDGDEVTLRGRCERDGFASIGFGACVGEISPAWGEEAA